MRVAIDWTVLGDDDDRWDASSCLYLYGQPYTDTVVYIGKADYQTVHQRCGGPHKRSVYDYLESECRIAMLYVVHGEIILPRRRNLSSQLLGDVESLLIYQLRPIANIMCMRSRLCRPGLEVICAGDWPHRQSVFRDR